MTGKGLGTCDARADTQGMHKGFRRGRCGHGRMHRHRTHRGKRKLE
ncbi:MAG: hypothetical protein ACOC32_03570 [Nanoarchaeota archaeon]